MMNSTFDEALERLRGTGSEVAGGPAPNHGPMAAEALVAMGCDDVVVGWADRYRQQLDAIPPPRSPVTAGNWAQALGAIDRFGDWVAFFRAQLAEAPWQVVFGEWIGRLLPATPSAGAHGLIRTAHALRALATPRPRCASKSWESPSPTGRPTTVSCPALPASPARSISATRCCGSRSS